MSDRIYLPANRSPAPHEQRFQAIQPYATHYGWVSCRDYDCAQFLNGWQLVLPTGGTDAAYVRNLRDRQVQVALDARNRPVLHRYWFTEELGESGLVTFTFPPGQPCFSASRHRWHVRPPIFLHDRGELRRTLRFADFTDLYNEEGYRVQRARERMG